MGAETREQLKRHNQMQHRDLKAAAEANARLRARVEALEHTIEGLRTVLRSLISCGSTSATIKAMAMNTLEPGSGDAWLAGRTEQEWLAAAKEMTAMVKESERR
jgi:hypothetical protein